MVALLDSDGVVAGFDGLGVVDMDGGGAAVFDGAGFVVLNEGVKIFFRSLVYLFAADFVFKAEHVEVGGTAALGAVSYMPL